MRNVKVKRPKCGEFGVTRPLTALAGVPQQPETAGGSAPVRTAPVSVPRQTGEYEDWL